MCVCVNFHSGQEGKTENASKLRATLFDRCIWAKKKTHNLIITKPVRDGSIKKIC